MKVAKWAVVVGLLLVVSFAWADASKVTIQQIRQTHPESAWHWAKAILGIGTDQPMAVELQIMIVSLIAIPAAQLFSFWLKWGAKMIPKETSVLDYFFRQDPQRSLYAFLAALTTIAGGAAIGAFSTDAGDFTGWYNVLYNVVIVGTGGDLVINKGAKTGQT